MAQPDRISTCLLVVRALGAFSQLLTLREDKAEFHSVREGGETVKFCILCNVF